MPLFVIKKLFKKCFEKKKDTNRNNLYLTVNYKTFSRA